MKVLVFSREVQIEHAETVAVTGSEVKSSRPDPNHTKPTTL
jgi:hypothetical protein